MTDANTIIQKAYFNAISSAIAPVKVFEGEEPDNLTDEIYVVIRPMVSREQSTFSSLDLESTIQIDIHSWKIKYNDSESLNVTCDKILTAIRPTPTSVLDVSSDGLQITNLRLQTDRTLDLGELGGRKFISRNLIFIQNIHYIN